MGSSSHIDNKKKDILSLGKDPIQRLEHTLSAEKLYSVNFTKHNTKFCLTLHCNFSVDYNAIAVANILHIPKYLIKRMN